MSSEFETWKPYYLLKMIFLLKYYRTAAFQPLLQSDNGKVASAPFAFMAAWGLYGVRCWN